MGIGTTTLILLFGIGFALWIGGYAPGFVVLATSVAGGPEAIVNLIMANIVGISIAGIGIAAAAFLTSNSATVTTLIAYGSFSAIAYTLFMPLTFFSAVPLPYEIQIGIQGFFGLLFAITFIQFISGREI